MELPDEFVHEVNGLGFALTEVDQLHTFTRTSLGGEVYLTMEALGQDAWRVGVQWRQPDPFGHLPNPVVSFCLERFGRSADGVTIDLSTSELLGNLPGLLGECILPAIDLASS
jgi:hypothetical protein